MKILVALCYVASSAFACSQTSEIEEAENALSRLPVGATLTKVSLPRFDEKKRRASLLTADLMELKSSALLRGENLIIRLFDEEQKVSTTATMAEANYLIKEERIVATGELVFRSTEDLFLARGQGGIFSLDDQKAILLGHSETMFLQRAPKKEITMNKLQPILPLLTGIQILAAAPPPAVTTLELVEFERQVTPTVIPEFKGNELIENATKKESGLTTRFTGFLQAIGQTQILAQQAEPKKKPEVPFEDLFKPNKDRLIIKSNKGIYFDSVNQELVYLGRINLTGQSMSMSCTDGMKVLFDQPEMKPADLENSIKGDDPFGGFRGIGKLNQFSANGNISINGRTKDGDLIQAMGDRAAYDAKNETIIIRGKNLGFRMGNFGVRSGNQDAYIVIRILDDGNLTGRTEGEWQIALPSKKN